MEHRLLKAALCGDGRRSPPGRSQGEQRAPSVSPAPSQRDFASLADFIATASECLEMRDALAEAGKRGAWRDACGCRREPRSRLPISSLTSRSSARWYSDRLGLLAQRMRTRGHGIVERVRD